MTTALVLGKFLPPHRGHRYLAEEARRVADDVIVLLLARSDEPIPRHVRHAWLEEILPSASVVSVVADHPIDYASPAINDLWAAVIRDAIAPRSADVFLTSEPAYGEAIASRLGAVHVLVDAARQRFPVSGTAVRANPQAWWSYLEPCVRAWYVKRVCLLGAESTGTTTMAECLASLYGTDWVPEYGRAYSVPKDARGEAWTTDEFIHIARRQQELEDEAARRADRILFCDTDALATAIWHEQYLGRRSPELMAIAAERPYDLTFLTADDFPWVQDGTRNSERVRRRMQARFAEELRARREPVVELRGPVERRTTTATEAIATHLGILVPEPKDMRACRQSRVSRR